MPVIGRLDGQVEDVIISPISQRRREEESPTNLGEKTDTRSEPPEDTPHAPTHTPHTGESSAEPDELPVWLL